MSATRSSAAPVARRWQAIDPLLPAPAPLPPGCWGAARRFQLTPQIAEPDVAGALDDVLPQWRDHLAAVPGTDDEDTAALVMWPSRDIDGIRSIGHLRSCDVAWSPWVPSAAQNAFIPAPMALTLGQMAGSLPTVTQVVSRRR